MIKNIVKIFIIKPTFTISMTLIFSVEKITAFGGVAIGNIKAQLAAITTAIPAILTGIPILIATTPIIGRNDIVKAVLDKTSVKKTVAKIKIKIINSKEKLLRKVNCDANQSPKPVTITAFANAKPPPNNNNKPQGSSFISLHCNKSFFLFEDGIKKNKKAEVIAIPESVKLDKKLN